MSPLTDDQLQVLSLKSKQPNITMKLALVFTIQLGLLILVQCVHNKFDLLSKFKELQHLKKTYDSLDLTTEDFVIHVSSQQGLKAADKISRLPGQPRRFKFYQYSGYITVDPHHGRALYYYFAESTHKSSTKPLVLWLNGGNKIFDFMVFKILLPFIS